MKGLLNINPMIVRRIDPMIISNHQNNLIQAMLTPAFHSLHIYNGRFPADGLLLSLLALHQDCSTFLDMDLSDYFVFKLR